MKPRDVQLSEGRADAACHAEGMSLATYLAELFERLRANNVRFCVLRNHERLPHENSSNDIDLLVAEVALPAAMTALLSVPNVTLLSITRRQHLTSTFVHGVGGSCLQIDLFTALSWRGLEYMDVDAVLQRTTEHPSHHWIPVPDPTDEAIVSFFTSFVTGGFIKHGYAPKYVPAFRESHAVLHARLGHGIAPSLLTSIADAVARGRDDIAVGYVGRVRRSLLFRGLARQGLRGAWKMARHFAAEIRIQYAPTTVFTVVLLGPDGAGKTSVLEMLRGRLEHCSKVVETRHLRPPLPGSRPGPVDSAPVVDPHGRRPKGPLASLAQLSVWLAASWFDRIFRRRRHATIALYDRYFHDVLVDPRRYRYGGPEGFARRLSKLVPQPDVMIALDAPVDVLRERKQEVTVEETCRQRDAYLALVRQVQFGHVVNAARALEDVTSDVEDLVLRHLAQRSGWHTERHAR